jgi:predicted PP-loop superfamily ATPase
MLFYPLEKIAVFIAGFCLLIRKYFGTAHGFIEIDLESVEIRAVDTGKFRLSADSHTASAAHSRTVYHYRVH